MSVPPDPPLNVRVTTVSSSSIAVTWDKPEKFGSGGFAGYFAYARSTNASATVISTAVDNCSIIIPSLVPGETYTYTVYSLNKGGISSCSGDAADRPTQLFNNKYPSAPVITSVTFPSPSSAVVTWTAPADFGNGFAGYTVYAIHPDNNIISVVTPTNVTSAKITGLLFNVDYKYVVSVKAQNGLYNISSDLVMTNGNTMPGAPQSVRAGYSPSTDLLGHVAVLWDAPANNGGSALKSYVIKLYNAGNVLIKTITLSVLGDKQRQDMYLERGISYKVTVTATNKNGPGVESAKVDIGLVPPLASQRRFPMNRLLIVRDRRAINHNLPSSVLGLSVSANKQHVSEISSAKSTIPLFPRGIMRGLVINRISAVRTIQPRIPGVVLGLNVTPYGPNVDQTIYTVSWEASHSLPAVTEYIVNMYTRTPNTGELVLVSSYKSDTTYIKITNQPGHKSFEFNVAAKNSVGTGSPCKNVGPYLYNTGPGMVSNVVSRCASNNGKGDGVIVSWTPPSDNGGSPILSYNVTCSINDGSPILVGTTTTLVNPSIIIQPNQMIQAGSYSFLVKAINMLGTSVPAESNLLNY